MEVDVEIVETAGVEAGRTTDDAMDVVALFEEKLSSAGERQSAVNPVTRYANAYGVSSSLNTRVRCATHQPAWFAWNLAGMPSQAAP